MRKKVSVAFSDVEVEDNLNPKEPEEPVTPAPEPNPEPEEPTPPTPEPPEPEPEPPAPKPEPPTPEPEVTPDPEIEPPVAGKEYLKAPRETTKVECGNCGSKKIFKRTDLNLELEVGECEVCSRLFAVCPICSMPGGMEPIEAENFERLWKCPNCTVNLTLNTNDPNDYLDMWEVEPVVDYNPQSTGDIDNHPSMADLSLPVSR